MKAQHKYEVNDGPPNDQKGILNVTKEYVKVYNIDELIDSDKITNGLEVFSTFLRDESIEGIVDPWEEGRDGENINEKSKKNK